MGPPDDRWKEKVQKVLERYTAAVQKMHDDVLIGVHRQNVRLHLDDLVDPESPKRIAAAAVAAFGRIDGVVNNAAIVARSNLETTTAEFFDRMMAVNVRAALLLIQAAFPQLKANQGAVLNIGSINAHSGQANLLDYSLSKGAMQTLSRNLANAHAADRVARRSRELIDL